MSLKYSITVHARVYVYMYYIITNNNSLVLQLQPSLSLLRKQNIDFSMSIWLDVYKSK